jgi:CoA:oxalate CoA-transferase
MGALDGVRVLDLSTFVQGPQAGQMLADLGADVIKIEMPRVGDGARSLVLSPEDRRSAWFYALNRGKRSVTLDLHTDGGRIALRRLVLNADILLSNFKPGTLEAWELGYEALAALNPRLIYAAGSTFGALGPEAGREGADIVGQAAGGIISANGEDGTFPTPVGAVIADHSAAQNMTTAVLAALYARDRTGRGQKVEVSLLGGQVWAQAPELTYYFLSGKVPGRGGRGHPTLRGGLWRVFATSDGHIALAGAGGTLWPGFCRAIDRPDLIDDPRFRDRVIAPADHEALIEIVTAAFLGRTTKEWCERLKAEAQRYSPVQNPSELVSDPQAWANGYLVEAEHPEWGRITLLGNPIRLSDTPVQSFAVAPELGQHTEEVLLEAGFSWDELAELREQGAW